MIYIFADNDIDTDLDGVALSVKADGKCVVYSGDLRTGGRQHHLFESLLRNLPRNLDRRLLEGTMLSRPGRPSI